MKYLFLLCAVLFFSNVNALEFFEKDNIFSAGFVVKSYDLNVSSVSNAFHHEPMIAYGGKTSLLVRDNYRFGIQILNGKQYTREDSLFDMIFGGGFYQWKLNRKRDNDVFAGMNFGFGHYVMESFSFTKKEDAFMFIEPSFDFTLLRINHFHVELNLSYLQAFHSPVEFGGFAGGIAVMFSNKYR